LDVCLQAGSLVMDLDWCVGALVTHQALAANLSCTSPPPTNIEHERSHGLIDRQSTTIQLDQSGFITYHDGGGY
jgi:hypothetical protein